MAKLRVDEMSLQLVVVRGDNIQIISSYQFYPEDDSSCKSTMRFFQEEAAKFEVRPSFHYLATQAIESDTHGPEGVQHTMDQIQDWYHRRWVFPYAQECQICLQVKAAHGPSVDHKFEPKEK